MIVLSFNTFDYNTPIRAAPRLFGAPGAARSVIRLTGDYERLEAWLSEPGKKNRPLEPLSC